MIGAPQTTEAAKPRWLAALHQAENWLLVLVLAAMVLLPVSEVLRRMGLPIGIHGADDFLRHLTLIAGMLGGMIAARENRLLALSSLPQFLTGWRKKAAAQISGVFSALVTVCLAWAATEFVRGERDAATRLAYDIPTWWIQLALPIGFGVIVLRLLWHSAKTWRGRLLAVALTVVSAWFVTDSTTFSPREVRNLQSLSSKLRQPSRDFDTWLAAQLSPTTQIELAKYQGQGAESGSLKTALVKDLNDIVFETSIYEQQRFAGIALRSKTQSLISQNPQGWDRKCLNRLLIEDAYPLEVSRNFVTHPLLAPEKLVIPALVLLVVATVLGAPIFVTLGGTAAILFWGRGQLLASLEVDHYDQVTNPILAMVPLFTLAGYFLAESGASKRLVRVFMAWFGHIRGGPAIVTALVCAFFTTFTGGSGVTILALGGMLLPVLLAAKFTERHALGLVTGAGSLGILFPPCLPLILYGLIAQVPVKQMFLGGIGPGVVMLALVIALGVWMGRHDSSERRQFNLREARAAIWDAKWELLLPVVAFVTFFSKFALPTEAAAVTALYALFTQTVVHRDLKPLRDVPRVTAECGLLIGGILLILGTAMGFTNFLITEHAPEKLVDWATATIKSPWVFLLALNVVLIFVGGLIEIYAAIVVVVPLLVPVGIAFGIDPVHLGIIFLANMELGYLAPPVGLNLLLSSYRFNQPILTVMRAVIPMLLVQFVGVLLITYLPPLTTWLPGLFK